MELSVDFVQRRILVLVMLNASLLGLLFDPEDGGSIFFRNAGKLLPDYTTSEGSNLHRGRYGNFQSDVVILRFEMLAIKKAKLLCFVSFLLRFRGQSTAPQLLDSTLYYTTTVSFHILSNSLFAIVQSVDAV
jgi:hypothetical protein